MQWVRQALQLSLTITVLTVGGGAPAAANDLGDGMFAYDQGLYREAFEIWQPIAEAGDPTAQSLIAMVYERGEGVSRNTGLAAQWYLRAAQAGHPQSQYQLARYYRDGIGVEPDMIEAFAWFSLAADTIPKNASGENSATKAIAALTEMMDRAAVESAMERRDVLRATVASP